MAVIRVHPPEALRAFPLLSNGCAIREGGRSQCGGAALARLPWPAPRRYHKPLLTQRASDR
ncbi:hypothetical protein DBR23_28495 [Acidovorax sp. HMWF018]|nr:hypothetical protein DBR23_28495 [Acidovorax sp. HMWF018]